MLKAIVGTDSEGCTVDQTFGASLIGIFFSKTGQTREENSQLQSPGTRVVLIKRNSRDLVLV